MLEDTIGKRRFLGDPLDLLVLSACQTAQGNERAALGLAGVSLKAGATTTIASLWPIDDASTAQIMNSLYAGLDGGTPTTTALRNAQLTLILSGTYQDHPLYWSPFLVIGNWL